MDGEAKRLSQLDEQFEAFERQLKRYEELLAKSGNRFKSILRNDTIKGSSDKDARPESVLVPAANRMRSSVQTLSKFNDRFEEMIDNAEN